MPLSYSRLSAGLRRRGDRLLRRISGRYLRSAQGLSRAEFLHLFRVAGSTPDWSTLDAHFSRRTACELPPFPERISGAAHWPQAKLRRRADLLCEHVFEHGAQPPVRFDGGVDWAFDPTADPRKRWARELNRHQWLPALALAYQQFGDERYAEKFVELIDSWIAENPPPPLMNEAHVSWNLMNVGMRCVTWPLAFLRFYRAPAFGTEHKQRMLRALHDHARFLYLFKTHDNHLLRESNGLAAIAGHFPEFRDASRWRDRALQRLAAELKRQINADGSHIEMSIAYQWLAMEEFEATLDQVEQWRWTFPAQLREPLERGYRMLAATRREDGQWPQLGDGFFGDWQAHEARLQAAARRFGFEGELPRLATDSCVFPDAGLAIMRGGRGNSLLFKAGPFGGLHGHDDKLTIEVVVGGTPIIVDPGTCTYNTDDPLRTHLVSSHAHSTVLVDGMSQVRRWLPEHRAPAPSSGPAIAWRRLDDECFAVSGCYVDGYAPFAYQPPGHWRTLIDDSVRHRRTVLQVASDYWLLIDSLDASGRHRYDRQFQLAPGTDVQTFPAGFRLVHPDGNGLLAAFGEALDDWHCPRGSRAPLAGWARSDGRRGPPDPAPCLSVTCSATGPIQLLTLLVPCSEGGPSAGTASVTVRPTPAERDPVLAIRINDRQELLRISGLPGPQDRTDADLAKLRLVRE